MTEREKDNNNNNNMVKPLTGTGMWMWEREKALYYFTQLLSRELEVKNHRYPSLDKQIYSLKLRISIQARYIHNIAYTYIYIYACYQVSFKRMKKLSSNR